MFFNKRKQSNSNRVCTEYYLSSLYFCMNLVAGGGSVTGRCHSQDMAVPTAGSVRVGELCPSSTGRRVQRVACLLFKHTERNRISLFFTPWRLTQRVNLEAHSRAACYHQSSGDHQLVFGCTIKVMFSELSLALWIRVHSTPNPALLVFCFLT